jgi:hypothetical protein
VIFYSAIGPPGHLQGLTSKGETTSVCSTSAARSAVTHYPIDVVHERQSRAHRRTHPRVGALAQPFR